MLTHHGNRDTVYTIATMTEINAGLNTLAHEILALHGGMNSPYRPVNGHISGILFSSSARRIRTCLYNLGKYVAWYF